jgi:hypothetical protein
MASQPTHSGETLRSPRPLRRLLLAAGVAALLALVAWQASSLLNNSALLPQDDFVEYWAAGRLNAEGRDPYDPEQLQPLQEHADRHAGFAIMMWNPPWTLPLVMPFGLLPPRVGQIVWLLLHLAVVLFCADYLWRFFNGPPRLRWLPYLLALTFLPTAFMLRAGQITPFVLLGVVGFLHFHRRNGWLAGACCLLIAIKPHLLYLFWVALLLWGVRERRWSVFLGGAVAGLAATAVAVFFNPSVLAQYHDALAHRPPEQWVSPTAGAALRLAFGKDPFWLQFLPTLAGLAWFVPRWVRRGHSWDWADQMPLLVVVSLLTTSYGAWPFDLVVLLLPLLRAAVWVANRPTPLLVGAAVGCGAVINGAALIMNLFHVESFWFIWMTPAVLVAYLLIHRLSAAAAKPQAA